MLLLLLLSRFSRVLLCSTPEREAHQAPPSLRFSRQEHLSGLPFLSPMHESEKWKWSPQSCPTLCNPMDCSLPGSSIHGIFQARVLEWGAIAFSISNRYNTGIINKPAWLCCKAEYQLWMHCPWVPILGQPPRWMMGAKHGLASSRTSQLLENREGEESHRW